MSEVGFHDLFGQFKHKLWPKEGLGIKLAIWFSTTKSRESPQFPCVQVVCYIPLKFFRQGLQIFFRPHLNRRSAHKIMCPQSCGSLNFGNFETPTWESQFWEFWDCHLGVPGQNAIRVLVPWPGIEYTIRGKVVAFPKSGPWRVLWVCVCPWLVYAPNCNNYTLTNLLFGFAGPCEWLNCLSIFLVPSWNSSTPLYPRSATN
jgi:hypothetical protein